MKVRIKEVPEGWEDTPANTYISIGTVYELDETSKGYGWIMDDQGEEIHITLDECPHLDGGSWEIVPDEVTP